MASDESIRTDGSTVHRQGMPPMGSAQQHGPTQNEAGQNEAGQHGPTQNEAGQNEAGPPPIDATDVSELQQAQTVIRGSSVARRHAKSAGRANRTPAAVAKVLLNQHLNHFYLEELIGGGGMGAVFRAHDDQLDREVAIKVIPFVGDDPDLQRRFRNEAQNAAKLDHPRIARVFDVGSQDEWYYIVFEYIRGTNIRELVSSVGPLTVDDSVFFTCQVADALQHAADRGIVHRDIKPSNVLVGQDGSVKLVDMGLARSDRMDLSKEDETASGVTLGTFDYISPEQAKDPRAADLRSDIYSLGCTLFFMLTGQPPYPGGTMLQKLLAHGSSPPPDARMQRNEVSYELSAVIQKMLAKTPGDRYATGNDLIADLRELAFREGLSRSQGVGAVSVSEPSRLAKWVERNAPWIAAGGLLLTSVGAMQLFGSSSNEFSLMRPPSVTSAERIPLSESTAGSDADAFNSVRQIDADSGDSQDDVSDSDPGNSSMLNSDSQRNSSRDSGESQADVSLADTAGSNETGLNSASLDPANSDSFDNPDLASAETPFALGAEDDPRSVASGAMSDLSAAAVLPTGEESSAGFVGSSVDGTASRVDDADDLPAIASTISKVRVVDDEISLGLIGEMPRGADGALLARSLGQALDYAHAYDQVKQIEIAASSIVSPPIVIKRDGLAIVSTVQGGTRIVFRSPPALTDQRTKMVSLGSNKAYFEGLHLQWDVPRSNLDGGALIAMNENKMVQLTDCTLTVRNPASRTAVCAFEVTTDPDRIDRQRDDLDLADDSENAVSRRAEDQLPLVAIQLYNVIVRGQMTMIQMDHAAALQLQWENGLLAVSQRMIETGGARLDPSPTSPPILLSLSKLTSHTPLGVMQMQLDSQGPYPVEINRKASNSVFVVDKSVPHIEVTGLEFIDDNPKLVQFDGESNAYEVDDTMLDPMLMLTNTRGRSQPTLMADLTSVAPRWFDEKSPFWSVWWSSVSLVDIPSDQLTPKDYRQDGAVFSGFDEKALPKLPSQDDKTLLDTQLESSSKDRNSALNFDDSRP